MSNQHQLELTEFIPLCKNYSLVDVRSPIEYNAGHIPGAINIPLFEDHERAEIGKIYKLNGKEDAVMRGLEIVSPKLASFVKSVKELNNKKVFIYCFRGGMRSNSFATLMNTAGLQAYVLKGGYKNYRRAVLAFFSLPLNLILLGGTTGSGKTAILKELEKEGEQVVDLEKLAQHRGSAFGSMLNEKQPTQQNFENQLFTELCKRDIKTRIWIEDESFSIGSIKIPYPLWLTMKKAPVVKINLPFEVRTKRLIDEYGNIAPASVETIIKKISKRLGGLQTTLTINYLENKEIENVTKVLLHYYDNAYNHDYKNRTNFNLLDLDFEEDNVVEISRNIILSLNKLHDKTNPI